MLDLVRTFHASIRRWIALHSWWTIRTVCFVCHLWENWKKKMIYFVKNYLWNNKKRMQMIFIKFLQIWASNNKNLILQRSVISMNWFLSFSCTFSIASNFFFFFKFCVSDLILNILPFTQTGLWSWTWQTSTKSHGLWTVHGFRHWSFMQANWERQSSCVLHLVSDETNVY